MGDLIKLVDVTKRRELLEPIYEKVFRPSFRPDELDPLNAMSAVLDEQAPTKDMVAALSDDNEVLGAIVGDWFPHSHVYLLSYLAIRPDSRGRGIGSQLMRYLPHWSRRRGALLTVAEVDDPRMHSVSITGDPVARLRFYQRFGGKVLDIPYIQPIVRPGGRRVSGMLLLAFDIQPQVWLTSNPPALNSEVLLTFLSEYFDQAEGLQEDPERTRLENTVSERAGIAVLPIDDYAEVPPSA